MGAARELEGKSQFHENECDCRAKSQKAAVDEDLKAALDEDLKTKDKSARSELEMPRKRRVW